MPSNPTPQAPQNELEGGGGEEAIPTPEEVRSRLDALVASPPGSLLGRRLGLGDPDDPQELLGEERDAEFWAVINSDPLSAYWVANALQRYEREESYRAALARGVWWG